MDRRREERMEDGTASATPTMGEAAASVVEQAGETLERGQAALAEMQTMLTEKTRECIQTTDAYVRENPWKAVGIAAGAGLIVGLLIGRR